MAKITLEELVDIAFAHEEGDPFDWGVFKDGKEQAMAMIGSSILEQFDKEVITDADRLILLSTITKLVTENMILHSKLLAKITLEELVDIAFAHEEGDPFDWGVFKDGKEQAMAMIGSSILEQFDKEVITDADRLILLSTITKLVTENMILHSKLLSTKQ